MNARFVSTFVIVVAICGGWLAGRLMSADSPKSKANENDLTKIERQIAATSVKLAENQLQVIVDANQTLPNTFPRTTVEQAQQAVAVARQRAKLSEKDDAGDMHARYTALADADQKTADSQYRAALAAIKLVKDAVPPLEVERLRLTAELTKLRLDRARQAKDVPEVVLVDWQLEDLREQVRQIVQQVQLYRGNE